MIYHIYWGTSGNSGLYLDEIYQVLNDAGHKQRVFVNYYYPFDYGDKVFFRYGDVAHSKLNGLTRKIVQLLEILCGFIKILVCGIVQRPRLINYSHAGQSYKFIYWYLNLLKFCTGSKLVVTCHDVMPFGNMTGEMANRKKIFHTADFLMVHNENSIQSLVENFAADRHKIVKHLFPIMDLSKLTNDDTVVDKDIDFLFIGHLRKEKGIDFLLDTWPLFHSVNKDATLKVCGRKLDPDSFDENELCKYNIDFLLRFIDDDEYYDLVRHARYVLLPYTKGTNSGIISTVLSLGTKVITSDIPMFRENPLVPEDCMFINGDKDSFINKLQEKWSQNNQSESNPIDEYRKQFSAEVQETYCLMLV